MKKSLSSIVVIGVIALIVVIILGNRLFYTLNPGEKGVVFRPFSSGLDKENYLSAGFHMLAPWNNLYVYDVREQQVEENMDILDNEGLQMHVDVSVRFMPVFDRIGYLHEYFGVDYIKTLIIPEVRSAVRKVMGHYKAEEIFSTKRKEVEDSIYHEIKRVLGSERNNIEMTALLIRSIQLPPQIKQAIEDKLEKQQEAEAYKYRIEREKAEAERRIIEAEGIARANMAINNSLTSNILQQKGIDATLELAKSSNTKIVVVGSSEGLPLILGQ